MDPKLIKVLAFDADDTLWVNESFYHEAELSLYKLLEDSVEKDRLSMQLFATEMKNIPIYGYGGKSFTLSMIEAAINITNNTVSAEIIGNIIDLGKELVQRPIVLIEGVREVLDKLKAMNSYSLILATKGDLLDQRRKLKESGLINYFDKIDVMDKKSVDEYSKIMKELKIRPEEFMMIGNSMRSDVQPVLELGANAGYIPFEYTWQHEITDNIPAINPRFHQMSNMKELLQLLNID